MKLLNCETCGSIRSLHIGEPTVCLCGASKGQYERDGINAWHSGPSKLLGISNTSFLKASIEDKLVPKTIAGSAGYRFDAFFIPDVAPTVRKIDG